jgi:hypothetical protein
MISSFWQKELAEFWRNKKLLVIKLIFPLVMTIPLFIIKAPTVFLSTVISSLIVALGIFNAGTSIAKDKSNGVLQRIIVTPLPKEKIILDEIFANSVIEFVQFLPILVLLITEMPFFSLPVVVAFLLTIIFANTLGILSSRVFSSSSEIRLLVLILIIFPLLVLSGVIVPLKSQLHINFAKIFPSSYLHQSILLAITKQSIFTSQEILILPIFPTLFFIVMTVMLSEKIIRAE